MDSVTSEAVQTQQKKSSIPEFLKHPRSNKLDINDSEFIDFLEHEGFRTIRTDDTFEFVRINGNIIKKVKPIDIKRYVLDYVREFESTPAVNHFLNDNRKFSVNYLNALKEVHPFTLRDNKDAAYYLFKNGIVAVTRDGIYNPIPYDKTEYLVWEHEILNREFRFPTDLNKESFFSQFLRHLADQDNDRFYYMLQIIGYVLHKYRDVSNMRAIIFNDKTVNEQPEGGNGKSLFCRAFEYFVKVQIMDGKIFMPNKSFIWSNIKDNTNVVVIDDADDYFPFKDLFSVITSGFTIERKFKDKFHLPVEKSPRIIITTNKIIRGYGGSHKRRQYVVDIGHYFSSERTPVDVFGHRLFHDWDAEEWARFDYFMLCCVHIYLKNGVVPCAETENAKKDTIRATSESFYNWIEDSKSDLQKFISTCNAKKRYLEESGLKNMTLSDKKFIMWIKKFCEINGHEFVPSPKSDARGFFLKLNMNAETFNVV